MSNVKLLWKILLVSLFGWPTIFAVQAQNLVGASQAGGAFTDTGEDIQAAPDGTVWVLGKYTRAALFGADGTNRVLLTGALRIHEAMEIRKLSQFFLAKYDASLSLALVRAIECNEVSNGNIAAASDGDVYLSGTSWGTTVFGPGESGQIVISTTHPGNYQGFLAMYGSDGSPRWVRKADMLSFESVTQSAEGGACVTGSYWATAVIGPGDPDEIVLSDPSGSATVLAHFRTDGTLAWLRQMIPANYQSFAHGRTVSTTPDGGALLAGNLDGTATFESGQGGGITLTASAVGGNVFLAKYKSDGSLDWARRSAEGLRSQTAFAQIVLSDGAILTAGNYRNPVFDPEAPNKIGLNEEGLVIAKYDSSGNILWARLVATGATLETAKRPLAVTARGEILLTGNGGQGEITVFGPDQPGRIQYPGAIPPKMFLAKFAADASLLWVRRAEDTNYCRPSALVGMSDFAWLTGSFSQPDTPSPGGYGASLDNSIDVFLTKYQLSEP